jgi:shikimate dehydrogenase
VADIVYVPLRTPLIEAARARGLRTAEGLGMLLHQAAPSFERWFGRRPDVTPELRALVEEDVRAAHKGREANQ